MTQIPNWAIWLLAVYTFIALGTFGHLLRSRGRHGWRKTLKYLFGGFIWPVYWTIEIGPTETIVILKSFLVRTRAFVGYSVVTLLFPAFYLYSTWDQCSGWSCGLTLVKAVVWAPFWPAYFAGRLTSGF